MTDRPTVQIELPEAIVVDHKELTRIGAGLARRTRYVTDILEMFRNNQPERRRDAQAHSDAKCYERVPHDQTYLMLGNFKFGLCKIRAAFITKRCESH